MVEVRAFDGTQRLGILHLHSGKVYKIGREKGNDLQLDHPGLSRVHLKIEWAGENDFFVTDPGSANGSWFKETRIPANRRIRMSLGSEVRLTGPEGIRIIVEARKVNPESKKPVKPLKGRSRPLREQSVKQPERNINSASQVQVALYHKGEQVRKISLVQDEPVYIGRAGFGADIEVNAPGVSRRHARLRLRAGAILELTDAGSSNGTFVKGNRVEGLILFQGDQITFGGTPQFEIRVEKLAHTGPAPTPPPIDEIPNLNRILSKHKKIVLGRDSANQVTLPHPTVSRFHAEILAKGSGVNVVKDLGSRNGTRVNGELIQGPTRISLHDVISIGPYEFTLGTASENLLSERIKSDAAISANGVTTRVDMGKKTILHPVDLKIQEGEMIAIMGPSGCGKSTLMNALNGYFPATRGKVHILGIELNKQNYPYLKQFIGFVPQDDIVHKNLTVAQSLRFAAKLKLTDASEKEIKDRIEETCKSLKITNQDVEGIQNRRVSELSGGQRKRVSIAVELLTQPRILFLDEPTSPLDPQTIDEFLECLKGLTRPRNGEPGTTVVLVTHKPGDLAAMDRVIFMAAGGYLAYFGKIEEYKNYFKVDRVNEVYQQLSNKQTGPGLLNRWEQTSEGKAAKSATSSSTKGRASQRKQESGIRQAWWLTRRYFRIKTNDRVNTLLLLAQAPIIGALTVAIFPSLTQGVFFMMAISAIWFGTNNAAREIVGEWAIYVRERMFNLKILPYLVSKLVVLTFLSCIQATTFVAIIYWGFQDPESGQLLLQDPLLSTAGMILICFVSSLIGLLISVAVDNTEKVMTLVPLVLIPQILLSGMLAPIQEKTLLDVGSYLPISRWSMELLVDTEGEIYEQVPDFLLAQSGTEMNQEAPREIHYSDPEMTFQLKSPQDLSGFPPYKGIPTDLLILFGWGGIYLLVIIILLKRKDRM